MNREPEIRVGLITDGEPQFCRSRETVLLHNLLIGEGFHWQRRLEARLRGRVGMLPEPQRNIHAVNILPVEDYLLSVIGSEMNPNAPIEFLKAHALISRSWALRKILVKGVSDSAGRVLNENEVRDWEESDSHQGFDVCSDDHCQRYQGLPLSVPEAARNAISATRGEVIVDGRGEVADARFSKCCGGRTERFSACWADMDYDYLQVRPDEWCDLSDMRPDDRAAFLNIVLKDYDRATPDFHDWRVKIAKSDIRERIKSRYGVDTGDVEALEITERGGSGRVTRLRVKGADKDFLIGKELQVRRLLSASCLYSSWFDVKDGGEFFILDGHGWGHGVGLCQIGAARMAYEGKDYREILNYYYPDTEIKKLYE